MKIAFLFLTVSAVFHEDYWQSFLQGHEKHYSLYVHAKNQLPMNAFFKPYTLSNTVPTTWANTLYAQHELLKAALHDPSNQKFIFVSESTIPLTDFDTVYKRVMGNNNSIFAYSRNPHQDPLNDHYAKRSLNLITPDCRYKNSQWVVLSRKHAELMVKDTPFLDKIAQYEADNELYAGSFLASQDLLHEVTPRDTTYVSWSPFHAPGERLPVTFSDLTNARERAYIIKAIRDNYLFARKFAEAADLTPLDPYLSYRKPPTPARLTKNQIF